MEDDSTSEETTAPVPQKDSPSAAQERVMSLVLDQDSSFSDFMASPNNIQHFYWNARKKLLHKKALNNDFILKKCGDRRYAYMRAREDLLAKKYPERNQTNFDTKLEMSPPPLAPAPALVESLVPVKNKELPLKSPLEAPMKLLTGIKKQIEKPFVDLAMTNLPPFTEAVSSTLRSARGDRSRRKSEPLKREKIHPRASVPETPSKFRDSTTGVPPKSLTPDAAPPVKRQLTASSRGQTARSMFIGVHHCVIMNDPVRRIKFKPKSRGLLGIASGSTFRICDLFHSPPYETLFEGHKLPIVDFDWSNSDHLITGSSDKTVRIYNLTEKSTKAILLSNEVIAVRFHPLNHNLIAVSTLHSMIYFFNQSGKVISHCKISSTARCMDFSTDGTLLFFGCADGKVRWFKCTKDFQDFKYAGSNVVSVNRSINSISYRDLHTNALRIPSLLVNLVDSTIKLFRINRDSETTFSFYPWVECPVLNISEVVRSSFAPLPSESEEGFIATGSENQTVIIYVYPTTPSRDSISKSRQVDALQGHTGIVNDVSWNCDETLLASSDSSGMVIVWKRWKKPSDFQTPT